MDFSTSFDDVWVEQLETRVVLPEGAKHIKPSVSVFFGRSVCGACLVQGVCCYSCCGVESL
jgi:hypothetical protein